LSLTEITDAASRKYFRRAKTKLCFLGIGKWSSYREGSIDIQPKIETEIQLIGVLLPKKPLAIEEVFSLPKRRSSAE